MKHGADPVRVIAANLDFGVGVRPAWVVAAICLAFVLAGLARKHLPRIGRVAAGLS